MEKPALKPYPTYKPAGVPWLQQVPEHWEVVPNRALFSEVKESGRPEDEMLSVTIGRGVLKQAEHLATTTKKDSSRKDKSTYKRVGVGDIVYNKMRAWQGAFGVSKYSGIVSPAYVVQRPMDGTLPEFYHFLLRTPLFAKEAERNSYGLASDIWNLRPEHFKTILNVRPPIDEQHLIVRYLHDLDAKVKRYIRAKRSLIARLQEQKQAIIQRAVTRGLDPNVPLKPSGVEWLGEVPKHWEVRPAKYIFREIDERSKTGREELLSVSHITGVTPRSQKEVTMFMAKTYAGHKVCREGDLVINTMWAWAGALGVTKHVGLVSPAYAVYRRFERRHHDTYLDLLLRTSSYKNEFFCASTGLRKSRLRMYPDKFFRVGIPCPSLDEQTAILDYVSSTTKGLDLALQQTQQEVSLMNEYHTRLIADVVTGAVDVRETARRLPANEATSELANEAMEEEPLSMAAEGEAEYGEL